MSVINEPAWLQLARQHIGTREIPGARHEPKILQWWRAIRRAGIRDDETPWCAAFVGAMLEQCGIVSSRFEGARSYLTWGVPLAQPALGCIVVLGRDGGGHVGFVCGVDRAGQLLVLGGNQGNEVNVRAFPRARVLAYRWPQALPLPGTTLTIGSAPTSRSEA